MSEVVLRRPIISIALAVAAAATGAPRSAGGQVFAGEAVEEALGTPLVGLPVRLLRGGPGPEARAVDSARTDARGLFQLTASGGPGAYHVAFGATETRSPALSTGPVDRVATADTTVARRYTVPVLRLAALRPYYEFQVEHPAAALRGRRAPKYPPALRARGVEGTVVAQFVVDSAGRPVDGTFAVLGAADPAFVAAVRAYVPTMRYQPARVGGIAVRQVVHEPFAFSIKR